MGNQLHLGKDADNQDERVLLKTDRLTTHGVILGMTGSGKTGFGLVMLEELSRANVPIIAIDPKGDLANLALLFPEYDEASFKPWVEDPDEAASKAALWKGGTEGSGISRDDVQALKDKLEVRVFTPGSKAGIAVDLLGAFKRPTGSAAEDPESMQTLVQSTVSGLLGLAGQSSDPVRDPAHIVLSRIVGDAWSAGEDPDLETLILRLVDPPFEKVGVFPLEQFFPNKDRMEIAMALNAVVASPAFRNWQSGAALDPEELLQRPEGKTRVSIFNIAHLDEVQRTFFLSLLLGKLLAHSRQMPGTSELRGLIFFDEVAGYLPPHPKNPPTKAPLLTMMKQARAVGLGVVLSTQNPVDLDYKALSNAGVWAIGRLQTQQDRDRVLKGMGRPELDDRVEALKKREFVLFDAKADEPKVLKTRFAMCFLRGPLTRKEIEKLSATDLVTSPENTKDAEHEADAPAVPQPAVPPALDSDDETLAAPPGGEAHFLHDAVVSHPALKSIFESHLEPPREDHATVYAPALYADLMLRFDEDRAGFFLDRRLRRVWFPLGQQPGEEHASLPLPDNALRDQAVEGARFVPLPKWCDESKELTTLKKRVVDDVYRHETAGMFVHKKLKLNATVEEDEAAFRARVERVARDALDEKLAKLHERYQKKADSLQDKLARAQDKVNDLKGTLRASQTEEIVDIGATIFSMFTGGRKKLTGSKMRGAVRRRSRSSRASQKIESAEDQLAGLQEDVIELQDELEGKIAELEATLPEQLALIEKKEVRLEKADIRVDRFGILWVPVTKVL